MLAEFTPEERELIARKTAEERERISKFLAQIDRDGMLGTSRWAHSVEDELLIAGLVIGSPPRDGIPYNCLKLTPRGRVVLDAGGDVRAGDDIPR